MIVSSRTPEGFPGRCPMCGRLVQLELSYPMSDATCPNCGTLLCHGRQQTSMREPAVLRHTNQRFAEALFTIESAFILAVCGVLLFGSAYLFAWFLIWLSSDRLEVHYYEGAILSIIAVLLFGRFLPKVGYYMGRCYARMTFRFHRWLYGDWW